MQFVDLQSEYQQTQQLDTKPRNFVATENESSLTKIVAHCLTPNRRNLVTLERLNDDRTGIEVASLKFWHKTAEDFTDFQLTYFVHLGRIESKPQICALSDDMIAVSLGSDEVKIWHREEEKKWVVLAALQYQGLEVLQLLPCKLRLKSKKDIGQCLAILHKHGCVSFWSLKNLQLEHALSMHEEVTKIAFEASYRYIAALTSKGSVTVWKMKGLEPTYQWDLKFESVTDIVVNSATENQFFVLMNANDAQGKSQQNSVLLFQFSRPQNLIMFWRFKTPITAIVFTKNQSSLLVFNRNGEC